MLDWQGRILLNCGGSPETPRTLLFGDFSFPELG
jgi:hypothetical protein